MEQNFSYLRLSVTDRCHFNCFYCQPRLRVRVLPEDGALSFSEMTVLVNRLVAGGIKHVRLTGGEPLLRKDLLSFSRDLSGLPGLECLSMTTNGYYLPDFLGDLKTSGLGSINISLDTLQPRRFEMLTGVDGLFRVLKGVFGAKESGLRDIRLNVVLMRGFNDDEILDFVDFGLKHGVDVRFIEYFSTSAKCDNAGSRLISSANVLKVVEALFGDLEYIGRDSLRGPAVYYRIPGRSTRIGFISSVTGDFCAACNRIRVTCDGRLYVCLHSDFCVDLKPWVRGGDLEEFDRFVKEATLNKKSHNKRVCHRQFEMSSIGG